MVAVSCCALDGIRVFDSQIEADGTVNRRSDSDCAVVAGASRKILRLRSRNNAL